jgi:hypothetical protein
MKKKRDRSFRENLLDLLKADPFEPFRIKLVNGDIHDIFYDQNVFIAETVVHIHSPDQNWALCPIDKVASVESLLADFQAETQRHAAQE